MLIAHLELLSVVHGNSRAAAGIAYINSIGTFGGFVGPYMMGVFKDATGDFTLGILAMAGVMVVTTALSASLKLMVRQE